jgi:hypothetical protein
MSKLPPGEGGSLNPEAANDFSLEQLTQLFVEAGISKKAQGIILKDFAKANSSQKQWLKKRLETIISSSSEVVKRNYKITLLDDWEKHKLFI